MSSGTFRSRSLVTLPNRGATATHGPRPAGPVPRKIGRECQTDKHTLQVFRGSGYGAEYLLVSGPAAGWKAVEKGAALLAAGKQQPEPMIRYWSWLK